MHTLAYMLNQNPTLINELSIKDLQLILATGDQTCARAIHQYYKDSWMASILFPGTHHSALKHFKETEQRTFSSYLLSASKKADQQAIYRWANQYAEHFINWMAATPYYLDVCLLGALYSLFNKPQHQNGGRRVLLIKNFIANWNHQLTLAYANENLLQDDIDIYWLLAATNQVDLLTALYKRQAGRGFDLNKGPKKLGNPHHGLTIGLLLSFNGSLASTLKTISSPRKPMILDLDATASHPENIHYGTNPSWWLIFNNQYSTFLNTLHNQPNTQIALTTGPVHPDNIYCGATIEYLLASQGKVNSLTYLTRRTRTSINLNAAPQHPDNKQCGITIAWWLAFHSEIDVLRDNLIQQPNMTINTHNMPTHRNHDYCGIPIYFQLIYRNAAYILLLPAALQSAPLDLNLRITQARHITYGTTPAWWLIHHDQFFILNHYMQQQPNVAINLNACADSSRSPQSGITVAYLLAMKGCFEVLDTLVRQQPDVMISLSARPRNINHRIHKKTLKTLLQDANQLALLQELERRIPAPAFMVNASGGKRLMPDPIEENTQAPAAKKACFM